VIDSH